MALNTLKCDRLMPLRFKGLTENLRDEPLWDKTVNTKPGKETGEKDIMIDDVKGGR